MNPHKLRSLLFFALVCLALPMRAHATGAEHTDGSTLSAHADCHCEPDCDCHKPGGTCPGDTCSEDCDCAHALKIENAPKYIHPAMLEAIAKNEKARWSQSSGGDESDFVLINGVKQPTGFKPDASFYKDAETLNIQVPENWEMKEIDYSAMSFSPVRGQIQGSCWAEGCGSAIELSLNAANPGGRAVVSVQDIIDCSKFGTARGGGQLSLSYPFASGIALESDYNYKGYDQTCKKNVARFKPLKRAPMLRGATGGFPTEREINYALHTIGAFEVCGSASALAGGGWQETIRGGSVNHCYAHGGMRWGPNYGKAAKWFHGMKNSWGDGTPGPLNPENRSWGDFPKGWGWYVLAKEVGGKLSGSVVTEIQAADAGPVVPREPVLMLVRYGKVRFEVTFQPGAVANKEVELEKIKRAVAAVEARARSARKG